MPTTSNFGWTTPADTDLVKDGALAIRTLGNGIDTSFLDLKGGTTGQVLSKASNTDLDFSWVAQDDSNAIQNAIVDAKGDLISATAADTPARLAVGTNGQVLTADSTTSTGLKWAAPTGASFSGAQVYRTTDQTISDSTTTTVNWTAENIDVGGYHDNSTNNSRLTIPSGKGGYYWVFTNIMWAADADGWRLTRFAKNGNILIDTSYPTNAFNVGSSVQAITQYNGILVELAAGDYVEVQVYHTGGGNLNIAYACIFGCTLLGA